MIHWKKTCTWASIDFSKPQISILGYENQNGINLKCTDYVTDHYNHMIIQTFHTYNYDS